MAQADPNFEVHRIPFTVRLRCLGTDQQLGISVTDSEEVIRTQRQIYEPICRGIQSVPLPPAPVPVSGSKPRSLYVLYDSPVFILAQSIAHSHLQIDIDKGYKLSFPKKPLSTDEKILDVMIDKYEDFCFNSLHAHESPEASNGFHHALMQSQLNILPSMVCRDLLKAAMVGLFRGGDIIDSIEYDVEPSPPSKTSKTKMAATAEPMYVSNMDVYRQKVRRQKTFFNGTREQYALVTTFQNTMSNTRKYPLDLKFVRILPVPSPPKLHQESIPPQVNDTVEEKSTPQTIRHNPRPKRATTSTAIDSHMNKRPVRPSSVTSRGTVSSEVITIDSDDEEMDVIKPPTAAETAINVDDMEKNSVSTQVIAEDNVQPDYSPASLPPVPPSTIVYPPYTLFPDPIPKFTCNTFVFISSLKKPGYIINIRVLRDATSITSLLRSYIVYVVYVKFGLAYIREVDLQLMNDSTFINQGQLKYDGVIVTPSDQLRLWPSIYLNDSLVNFYLKWIQKKYQSQDIFIFPTYFYSRVSHFEEGGVVYKDNKEQRGKLWNDLKGWTKGTDIFSKSFILFPINFHKHWSFVLLCNPGEFLRIPLKKTSTRRKKQVEVSMVGNDDDHNDNIGNSSDDSKNESVLMGLSSTNEKTHTDETVEIVQPCDGTRTKPTVDTAMEVDDMEIDDDDNDDDAVKGVNSSNNPVNIDLSMDSGSQTDNTPDSAPCLIHFDSGKRFKSHTAGGVFRVIRKYFHACYEATKGKQYPGRSVDAKSIPGISPDLPQQVNAEDCGVYMLEFMERLLMTPSSIDGKAIISMEKNNGKVPANFWFTAEVASRKRESIDYLISTLAKENGRTDTSK